MEVMEASMKVVEASTEVVEASVTSMEASTAFTETSTSIKAGSHFHRSWKLPWKLLVEASVEVPSGSFHGSFRGTGFNPIGFRELPSITIYFHNLQAVSGSFHCFHGSVHCFHCFHCFRGSFMEAASAEVNGRFHGSFRGSFYLVSTTAIGACFASIEASRSLHRFRGSIRLQRNSLPCAMEASVEAMEASMEAVKSFHFLWDWKLTGCYLWQLPWKL